MPDDNLMSSVNRRQQHFAGRTDLSHIHTAKTRPQKTHELPDGQSKTKEQVLSFRETLLLRETVHIIKTKSIQLFI